MMAFVMYIATKLLGLAVAKIDLRKLKNMVSTILNFIHSFTANRNSLINFVFINNKSWIKF